MCQPNKDWNSKSKTLVKQNARQREKVHLNKKHNIYLCEKYIHIYT